jgi:hypothetical protein
VTSGVWKGDWSSPEKLSPFEKIQLEQSDVISFHNYGGPEDFEKRVKWLEAYKRPVLCTEYMARPMGSTFQAILPVAKKYNVAAINWGFVDGKTQGACRTLEEAVHRSRAAAWFHDIFHRDKHVQTGRAVSHLADDRKGTEEQEGNAREISAAEAPWPRASCH